MGTVFRFLFINLFFNNIFCMNNTNNDNCKPDSSENSLKRFSDELESVDNTNPIKPRAGRTFFGLFLFENKIVIEAAKKNQKFKELLANRPKLNIWKKLESKNPDN